jgi:phospholipase/carboxylesterase
LSIDDEKYITDEAVKAEIILNKFIEQVKKNYNILSSKIVLCGFSQGCMMAINIALTNREKFNCVVGFSGKIIDKDDLERRKKNGPETLLIHGDADEVVPVSNILEAKDFLIRNNVSVNTKIIKNCGHHIPIEASSLALHFIKKNLEIK